MIGVDIAASMIDVAKRLHGGTPNLEFRVNTSSRLESIPSGSVDLVYTLLVLQHVRPRYVREYLAEFVRVLTPGGVLVFQLPSDDGLPVKVEGHPLKRLLPRPLIAAIRAVRRLREFPRMELHGLPRQQVEQLRAGLGAPVVDVVDTARIPPTRRVFATAPSNSGGNGGCGGNGFTGATEERRRTKFLNHEDHEGHEDREDRRRYKPHWCRRRLVSAPSHITAVGVLRTPTHRTAHPPFVSVSPFLRVNPFSPSPSTARP